LIVRLAFYTGPDSAEQLERLFEASGMFRPTKIKKSRHYLKRTVQRGLRQAIQTGQFFNWDWEKQRLQTDEQNQQLIEFFASIGKLKVLELPTVNGQPHEIITDALVEGGETIQVPLKSATGIDLGQYRDDPTFSYLWKRNHAFLKDTDRQRRIASVLEIFK